jgi:non-canonical (house-cleaning) NTP pyrophosphatase
MHIYIGSTSERKIAVVEKVVLSFFPNDDIILKGFAAASGVPETPWDRETYDGARNRALHVRKEYEDADLCIGLESGLIERYGHIFEEAWSVVIDRRGVEYYGYSSGLKVPDYIFAKMNELGLPHSEVMAIIERDHGKLPNDTWGTYSGGLIARTVSLEESLRNALIQVVAPEHSFYKK